MGIRRRQRPRHAKDDSEDMVIDLRERLAPYDRIPNDEPPRDDQADDAPSRAPRRRTRPLRSR